MEYYPNNRYNDGHYLNPHNRFLFIFCHASDVSENGWGCICCGRRTFNFKIAVFIFSIIMMFGSINDLIDITSMNYLDEKDEFFEKMYYFKLASDCIIIIGILFSLCSVFRSNYCIFVISYYSIFISFYFNTIFCIYTLTQIKKQNIILFLKNCFKGTFLTLLFWLFFDYVLLLFAWILFCQMIQGRRRRRQNQENLFNFKF